MHHQSKRVSAVMVSLAFFATALPCRAADLSAVRLVQRPVEDAARAEKAYVEGQFRYQDFEGATAIFVGSHGALTVGERLEIGGFVGLRSLDPERGGSETGLLDLDLYGRYVMDPINTDAGEILTTVGLLASLPTGSEDVLEGTFDVETFGAGRYVLEGYVVTGNLGIRFNGDYERDLPNGGRLEIPGEVSIFLGTGVLVPVSQAVTMTGEFNLETERLEGSDSVALLTPGIDALMGETLHMRGGLGIGLTDGAPDIELILGLAADF